MSNIPASIFDLSPPEKLQLVEDLWDDLAAVPAEVPIHDWQLEELEQRKGRLAAGETTSSPWEEVRARIRARYGR